MLVIDNNTQDEALWRPVEAHCAQARRRASASSTSTRSPGFKAGALNFALDQTAPDAEVVAVIDADYVVRPDWLRDLVPAFANPRIGIVQAPQDYRDAGESAFKAMCFAEYRGFFHIGMVTRNERNAIIQHGTMTMVRRDAARAHRAGPSGASPRTPSSACASSPRATRRTYIPRSYGRGADARQLPRLQEAALPLGLRRRCRSCAGTSRSLVRSGDGRLTAGQRYHFLAGWLPWLADGFNLLFNCAALAWSLVMVAFPKHIEPPLMIFSLLPLSLFVFKLVKLLHLYRTRVGANAPPDRRRGARRARARAHHRRRDAERPRAARPAVLPHAQAGARATRSARRWRRRARKRS